MKTTIRIIGYMIRRPPGAVAAGYQQSIHFGSVLHLPARHKLAVRGARLRIPQMPRCVDTIGSRRRVHVGHRAKIGFADPVVKPDTGAAFWPVKSFIQLLPSGLGGRGVPVKMLWDDGSPGLLMEPRWKILHVSRTHGPRRSRPSGSKFGPFALRGTEVADTGVSCSLAAWLRLIRFRVLAEPLVETSARCRLLDRCCAYVVRFIGGAFL